MGDWRSSGRLSFRRFAELAGDRGLKLCPHAADKILSRKCVLAEILGKLKPPKVVLNIQPLKWFWQNLPKHCRNYQSFWLPSFSYNFQPNFVWRTELLCKHPSLRVGWLRLTWKKPILELTSWVSVYFRSFFGRVTKQNFVPIAISSLWRKIENQEIIFVITTEKDGQKVGKSFAQLSKKKTVNPGC